MRGRSGGGGHGSPTMVGTARDRLESGAGAARTSGGGGRHTHGCNCRDDNDDNGDTRIGKVNRGGGVTGGPVAPVGRNGAGRRIKAYSFRRPEIHG